MTTGKMRDYLIDIIRTEGICDDRQHYFTEAEIRNKSPEEVKWLYDLCYPNFGERTSLFTQTLEWKF